MKDEITIKDKIYRGKEEIGGKPSKINVQKDPHRPEVISRILVPSLNPSERIREKFPHRPKVIIITPFLIHDVTDFPKQIKYLKETICDSLRRGEAPFSPVLLHFVFSGSQTIERDDIIIDGISWLKVSDKMAVYVDHGITPLMKLFINQARVESVRIEYRMIGRMFF